MMKTAELTTTTPTPPLLGWLGSIPVQVNRVIIGRWKGDAGPDRVAGWFALPIEYSGLVLNGGIYHLKFDQGPLSFDAPVSIRLSAPESRDTVTVEFEGVAPHPAAR